MKYKISDAAIVINGEYITVGTVLGEEDKPNSPFSTKIIPNSEYEKGLKNFTYGKAHIDDCCCHWVGKFENFKATSHVDDIWINELKLMGYDTSKLINA